MLKSSNVHMQAKAARLRSVATHFRGTVGRVACTKVRADFHEACFACDLVNSQLEHVLHLKQAIKHVFQLASHTNLKQRKIS